MGPVGSGQAAKMVNQLLVGVGSRLHHSYSIPAAAGETRGGYRTHRVGPVALLRAPKLGGLRDAAFVLLVQWYTHNRYLKGPAPFIGLVFAFSTKDLLH